MNMTLKETTESDLPFVLEAETDPSNSSYVDLWTNEKHRDSLTESDIRHMIIYCEQENKAVGYTIMAGFSGVHKCAELKRLVITQKGQGYGQQSLNLIKDYIFSQLDFHRLWLDVRDYNTLAIKLYERNGFSVEGHLRECVRVKNRYESIFIMGLLRDEYMESNKRSEN